MKILVIGNGGREHALAWRLAQGVKVQKVYVAPGNAGTALEDGVENVAITAIPDLIAFVQREHIELTVVGPEAPLAAGVVDAFRAAGLKIFGPTKAAAQLESSKDFAKRFMTRHNIPTAFFETFSEIAPAKAYVEKHGAPIVIKADGLAAGKGVVVAMTLDEAHAAIDDMLSGKYKVEIIYCFFCDDIVWLDEFLAAINNDAETSNFTYVCCSEKRRSVIKVRTDDLVGDNS